MEFNPDAVRSYRLLGYENRDIADELFRDPTVDAGEVGAGHAVTALYEVKLQRNPPRRATLAVLRLRYRPTKGDLGDVDPVELEQQIRVRDVASRWRNASPSLRLASLVAEYAEVLKGSYWSREGDLDDVLRRAQELAPSFAGDSRVADWISLVATAADLRDEQGYRHDEEW